MFCLEIPQCIDVLHQEKLTIVDEDWLFHTSTSNAFASLVSTSLSCSKINDAIFLAVGLILSKGAISFKT
ncbi:hypothetical protein AGMMS49921_13090 [Endomicrobiia bacterium]|nr:hypothetical protein AGMMS49921_13090 [Endomicrobiia bacterium]